MGLVLIKERRILFSEFALSKSQYLYNKNRFWILESKIMDLFEDLIIYKQQFLHSDWLKTCQLMPNQCKKV